MTEMELVVKRPRQKSTPCHVGSFWQLQMIKSDPATLGSFKKRNLQMFNISYDLLQKQGGAEDEKNPYGEETKTLHIETFLATAYL